MFSTVLGYTFIPWFIRKIRQVVHVTMVHHLQNSIHALFYYLHVDHHPVGVNLPLYCHYETVVVPMEFIALSIEIYVLFQTQKSIVHSMRCRKRSLAL
jgi:hypothetical protein